MRLKTSGKKEQRRKRKRLRLLQHAPSGPAALVRFILASPDSDCCIKIHEILFGAQHIQAMAQEAVRQPYLQHSGATPPALSCSNWTAVEEQPSSSSSHVTSLVL